MSYISTDFDNLNAGINILNIVETETSLLTYEGTYSDKGKGYKQQYVTIAENLNIPHLFMDFCFIFKDGFTTSNVTYLDFNYGSVLDIATPTITSDSDGNVVWLFENVDTWYLNEFLNDYGYFTWNKNNEEFYYYLHAIDTIGDKQPDDFDVVIYRSVRPNLTFEAHRQSPTSNVIEMTFDGTFYNGSLGLINNSIQSIEVYHFDDSDNKVTDKLLVENTDFTIDGNRIYSGTLSSPSVISITTGIFYNQKKNIWLEVKTLVDGQYFIYMITKGIPVFNWKEGELHVNGDLIVRDTDGENPVNILKLYSTSPKMIGYWINGEPIYRKIVDFGALPDNTYKEVSTGLNSGTIVMHDTYVVNSGLGASVKGDQYQNANTSIRTSVYIDKIRITANGNFTAWSGYTILDYIE